jgi:type III secretory pathway component EscR
MPLLKFECIFTHKDIGEEFHQFLKEDRSEESWEFLRNTLKLTKNLKKENSVSEKKLQTLCSRFVDENGTQAINIGSKARETLLKELKNHNLNALKPVQETVIAEMKFDSFKRFTRSKRGLKIIQKYSKDPTVVIPEFVLKKFSKSFKFDSKSFLQ